MIILRCAGGRSAFRCDARWHRNEPPFLRGQVVGAGQASGLVLRRRHYRCGTAPDSHRLRWDSTCPGPPAQDERSLSQLRGHGGQLGSCKLKLIWPLHLIPGGACRYCPAPMPITTAATRRPDFAPSGGNRCSLRTSNAARYPHRCTGRRWRRGYPRAHVAASVASRRSRISPPFPAGGVRSPSRPVAFAYD
jgi:hypothetical protein